MKSELTFQNTHFHTVKKDNQIWLTSSEIAKALGYAREDAVTKIYIRNQDEFASNMTMIAETPKLGCSNLTSQVRVFSLRGAHLIAMFARTPIAKDFRKWVLDVLDREVCHVTAKVDPNIADVLTRQDMSSLAALCTDMRYLVAWWDQYGKAIGALNKNMYNRLYDYFNDGAWRSSALVLRYQLGITSKDYVEGYPFSGTVEETFSYHAQYQQIQRSQNRKTSKKSRC